MTAATEHRDAMSRYYAWHSRIYDATRWAFLFGRETLLEDLQFKPGQIVVEVGCGTGANLEGIVNRVGSDGEVIAVDCAPPMMARCAERVEKRGLKNVHLVEREYGFAPVTRGCADVVLLSYSLSMIPEWQRTLECAQQELRRGGRIGIVDFYLEHRTTASLSFARWMAANHVILDRPYREELRSIFRPLQCVTRNAFGGLWSFYRFIGERT